jgi:hypothetical protein
MVTSSCRVFFQCDSCYRRQGECPAAVGSAVSLPKHTVYGEDFGLRAPPRQQGAATEVLLSAVFYVLLLLPHAPPCGTDMGYDIWNVRHLRYRHGLQ